MKFKLPKLHKQRLQAATRRMPQRTIEEVDDAEPNMRLSSAFIVVLVLHVVAVAGIYAFNSIKAHKATATEIRDGMPKAGNEPSARPPAEVAKASTSAATIPKSGVPVTRPTSEIKSTIRPPDVAKKTTDSGVRKAAAPTARSGGTYTVVKGDNALFIAKKFGVNYDELVKLNKIEDPGKLKIGRKLALPSRNKTD